MDTFCKATKKTSDLTKLRGRRGDQARKTLRQRLLCLQFNNLPTDQYLDQFVALMAEFRNVR
jgi:hypothetical protein